MTRRTVLTLVLSGILPRVLPADEAYALVTKKGNSRPITRAQLKNLLLGRGANWADGGKIRLVLGPPGEPSRVAALKHLADMTDADYIKNAIRLAFVGQADAVPLTLQSTMAVRQIAQVAPGTVGIIPPGEVNDSVTILTIE